MAVIFIELVITKTGGEAVDIYAASALQIVIASPAFQNIVAFARQKIVFASTARQDVVAAACIEDIIARTAGQRVGHTHRRANIFASITGCHS